MTVRTKIDATEGRFYITFTCYSWLKLFDIVHGYDIVYRQFDILKAEGHYIIGYVIMPNHLHFIIDFVNAKNINVRIGTMKRFMAYEIVQRLMDRGETTLLQKLASGVNVSDKKKGKLHEVFEPSFDIKQCRSNAFTEQKLVYIHNNPCKETWSLSITPEDYIHSSARFYNLNVAGFYEITHYLESR